MRIDWFLMTTAGKKFLNAILHYKNLEYYKITTIQMIIEYLYSRFAFVILLVLLPLYLLQLFFFTMTLLEYKYEGTKDAKDVKDIIMWSSLNGGINVISLFYNLFIFIKMPKKFFQRAITYIDLIFAGINLTLNALILFE